MGTKDAYAEAQKQQMLLSFLDHVAAEGEQLYILGDLFDFWFEYRTVIPRGFMPVLSALARLDERHLDLHYVAGNHDFWVRDFLTEEMGFRMHFDPVETMIEGRRFFLHHGDGVAKNDKGYRIMKRVFRYPPNIFLYSLLHPDLCRSPTWIFYSTMTKFQPSKRKSSLAYVHKSRQIKYL